MLSSRFPESAYLPEGEAEPIDSADQGYSKKDSCVSFRLLSLRTSAGRSQCPD